MTPVKRPGNKQEAFWKVKHHDLDLITQCGLTRTCVEQASLSAVGIQGR